MVVQHTSQVAVGVGTLAGSTMMLLTIATGGSILLGRCDLGASVGVVHLWSTCNVWCTCGQPAMC